MGRTEQSQGLAPPAIRKDIRAKQARAIINKTIPAILASNARARRGVEGSALIVNPPLLNSDGEVHTETADGKKGKRKTRRGDDDEVIVRAGRQTQDVEDGYTKRKGQGKRKAKNSSVSFENQDLDIPSNNASSPQSTKDQPKPTTIRIMHTDTLTAAHTLNASEAPHVQNTKKAPNICILNMASPLRPGGGVLTGATSQEEFLCARTTLLPSLREDFYRLPEVGAVWSKDVFVFRGSGPLGETEGELGVKERWWVDVVSAGMLRFPDVQGEGQDARYVEKKDRELVERKMRAVMRVCIGKGVRKLVLGAWGCGAYGNPVAEVARLWRKVLFGKDEVWEGLQEVVFAIKERKMAENFAKLYGEGMEVEDAPGMSEDEEEDKDENLKIAKELKDKIREMEGQIGSVWNQDLKQRLGVILDGLRKQLRVLEAKSIESEEDTTEDGESTDDDDVKEGSTSHPKGEDDTEEGDETEAEYEMVSEDSDWEISPNEKNVASQ